MNQRSPPFISPPTYGAIGLQIISPLLLCYTIVVVGYTPSACLNFLFGNLIREDLQCARNALEIATVPLDVNLSRLHRLSNTQGALGQLLLAQFDK